MFCLFSVDGHSDSVVVTYFRHYLNVLSVKGVHFSLTGFLPRHPLIEKLPVLIMSSIVKVKRAEIDWKSFG